MGAQQGSPVAYLDFAATAPVRPEVREAMAPFMWECYGNASASYRIARAARRFVEDARELVADSVGSSPSEVVFTSGGTEADNLAVFGTLAAHARPGHPMRALCSSIEHSAVLEPLRAAARGAAAILGVGELHHVEVGVTSSGVIDLDQLEHSLDVQTALVSVMAANNEVGSVQPLGEVAEIVRRRAPHATLHTDAVQAAPYLDLAAMTAPYDLVSLSAHKLGGPKGVGVLVVRGPTRIVPMLRGGGQERERRSGTYNVAGIVGLAAAIAASQAEREAEITRIGLLRDRFADAVLAKVPRVTESAPRHSVLPSHCHLRFTGVSQEELLVLLDEAGVCASAGSACASGAVEPSHVLLAMGVSPTDARSGLRFSFGYTSTSDEVERAVTAVVQAVERLRA